METQPILKKTLLTVAIMVGAWVAFVGTLSILALVVTSHIVGTERDGNDGNDTSEQVRHLPGSLPAGATSPARGKSQPSSPAVPQNAPPKETHHRESI